MHNMTTRSRERMQREQEEQAGGPRTQGSARARGASGDGSCEVTSSSRAERPVRPATTARSTSRRGSFEVTSSGRTESPAMTARSTSRRGTLDVRSSGRTVSPPMPVLVRFDHYDHLRAPPRKRRRAKRLTMRKRMNARRPSPVMPQLYHYDTREPAPSPRSSPPAPAKRSSAKTSGPKPKKPKTSNARKKRTPSCSIEVREEVKSPEERPSFSDEEAQQSAGRTTRGRGRPRKSSTPTRERKPESRSPRRKRRSPRRIATPSGPRARAPRSPGKRFGPNSQLPQDVTPQAQLPPTTASNDQCLPPKKRPSSRSLFDADAVPGPIQDVANAGGGREQVQNNNEEYVEVVLDNGETRRIPRHNRQKNSQPEEFSHARTSRGQPERGERARSVAVSRNGDNEFGVGPSMSKPRSSSWDAYRILTSETEDTMKKYVECDRYARDFKKVFHGVFSADELANLAEVLSVRADQWLQRKLAARHQRSAPVGANFTLT